MKREREGVVQGESCMWFDDKFNIWVCFMNVAIGMMLEEFVGECEKNSHLANSRSDAVAEGAFRF